MGSCCNPMNGEALTSERKDDMDKQKDLTKKVDKELDVAKQEDSKELKLLLLGAGGSGKSTLFKQLEEIHGKGFNESDRKRIKSEIHEQMLDSIKLMIERLSQWIEDYNDNNDDINNNIPVNRYKINELLNDDVKLLNDTSTNDEINDKIKNALKNLWNDDAIQVCYSKRNLTCIPDSTAIFLNNIDKIISDEYIPSQQDLLLVRTRTAGMNEKIFKIDQHKFKICDVGGQRNERRKWIHFFDNVTAVIFVAALSCYNEAVFEDETANAMDESMNVFHEHCNSKYFLDTAFILFLNKSDLFKDKHKEIPITVCERFSDFNGNTQNYDECCDYIKNKFMDLNENTDDREIYSHITNATNKNNIQQVFDDTQHIVVEFSLQKSGLL